MSLFTKFYDKVMGPLEKYYIQQIRKKILKNAHGSVLEIGIGTGANFAYYPTGVEVTGIEPSLDMVNQAKEKIHQAKVPIQLIHGQAEKLPFPDKSFDTVLSTLVLCSVKDLKESLKELHRVLKDGGTVILFEHVRLNEPHWIGLAQDILNPPWAYVCDGCNLNRNTIEEAEKFFIFKEKNRHFKKIFITAIGNK